MRAISIMIDPPRDEHVPLLNANLTASAVPSSPLDGSAQSGRNRPQGVQRRVILSGNGGEFEFERPHAACGLYADCDGVRISKKCVPEARRTSGNASRVP